MVLTFVSYPQLNNWANNCHIYLLLSGNPKRVRLTSLSSFNDLRRPFEKLKSLNVYLKSPTHVPILQYLVHQAINVENLIFDQFYSDYRLFLMRLIFFVTIMCCNDELSWLFTKQIQGYKMHES